MSKENAEKMGPDAEYWAHLRDGRFLIQRSTSTGEFVFYPRIVAPKSGASDLEWVEVSGEGLVYAVTVIARKPERGGPYNISLVELKEGPRMMTRIVGVDPHEVKIGMSVRAKTAIPDFGPFKDGDQPIVVFEPAERSL